MINNKLTSWLVIFSYVLTGWIAHGLHSHVHIHDVDHACCAKSDVVQLKETTSSESTHHCYLHSHEPSLQQSADTQCHHQPVDSKPVGHQHDHEGCQVCQLLFSAVTLSVSFGHVFETVEIPAGVRVESVFVIVRDIKPYNTRGPPVV